MRIIQIVPFGPMPTEILNAIAASIRQRFDCRVAIERALPVPEGALDARLLLDTLFDRLPLDVLRVVGVTANDLFVPGREFVFGDAHLRDRVAVISSRRVSGDSLLKIVTRELGRTFHGEPCQDPRCVMNASEPLDSLGADYCAACDEQIAQVAFVSPIRADKLMELGESYVRRNRPARAALAFHAADAAHGA